MDVAHSSYEMSRKGVKENKTAKEVYIKMINGLTQ